MSARRNLAQRTAPPANQGRPQMNGRQQQPPAQSFVSEDGPIDIKKMHPMAVLALHEDRLNEMDAKISQLQSQPQTKQQRSTSGDESAMIAECIKQIKYLTQENQTNRNLARELTLELLRLKTSLQEDGQIDMHVSEESQEKYEAFKEKANASQSASQNVRDELMHSSDTISFNGNGGYDPNAL